VGDSRIEEILALIAEMNQGNEVSRGDVQTSASPEGTNDPLDTILFGLKSIAEAMTQATRSMAEQQRVNQELVASIGAFKTLHGLLPICMYCKKIQDVEGVWAPLEQYLGEHTDAKFTHGLCHQCLDLHHSE
jgi:hypothetical protein